MPKAKPVPKAKRAPAAARQPVPKAKRAPRGKAGQQQGGKTFADLVKQEYSNVTAGKTAPTAMAAAPVPGSPANPPLSPTPAKSEPMTPGAESIREQIAELSQSISALEQLAGGDPEITALLNKRAAQREELRQQLRGTKPLGTQIKIATEMRDKAVRTYSELSTECSALERLLEAKREQMFAAREQASQLQFPLNELLSKQKTETKALMESEHEDESEVSNPIQLAAKFAATLPPEMADSFQNWMSSVPTNDLHFIGDANAIHISDAEDDEYMEEEEAAAPAASGSQDASSDRPSGDQGRRPSGDREEEDRPSGDEGGGGGAAAASSAAAFLGATTDGFRPFRSHRHQRGEPYAKDEQATPTDGEIRQALWGRGA